VNEQPTREEYQRAFDRLVRTDSRSRWPGDGHDVFLVGFLLGSEFEPHPWSTVALAVWRVFLGAELAETLTKQHGERPCTYCEGRGQVEYCTDVCQCGPTRCTTCDGTGVLS
jgi:hypothetical protein